MAFPELFVRPDPYAAQRTRSQLDQHRDEQMGVENLGYRDIGSNDSKVRFAAVRATEWVEVHVQHDGGGGGGVDYNDSTYVSRTLVDCRANRLQEVTVNRDGVNRYYCWLIPILMEA